MHAQLPSPCSSIYHARSRPSQHRPVNKNVQGPISPNPVDPVTTDRHFSIREARRLTKHTPSKTTISCKTHVELRVKGRAVSAEGLHCKVVLKACGPWLHQGCLSTGNHYRGILIWAACMVATRSYGLKLGLDNHIGDGCFCMQTPCRIPASETNPGAQNWATQQGHVSVIYTGRGATLRWIRSCCSEDASFRFGLGDNAPLPEFETLGASQSIQTPNLLYSHYNALRR